MKLSNLFYDCIFSCNEILVDILVFSSTAPTGCFRLHEAGEDVIVPWRCTSISDCSLLIRKGWLEDFRWVSYFVQVKWVRSTVLSLKVGNEFIYNCIFIFACSACNKYCLYLWEKYVLPHPLIRNIKNYSIEHTLWFEHWDHQFEQYGVKEHMLLIFMGLID